MCYALPARIISLSADTATVDYGGVRKKANVSMIGRVKNGDFVLIHAGFAIGRLTKKDALESLKLIRDINGIADVRESDDG